jgi:putative oxidoreductase
VELVCGIILTIGFIPELGLFVLILCKLYNAFFNRNGMFWFNDQHRYLVVLLGLFFLFLGCGNFSSDQTFTNYENS